jgi:hypothetical protein
LFVSSFINITRFFADLVIWDMPYGLGVAPWDVLLTDHELETFFQQLAVVNRSRAHALCLGCIWHDAGRVRRSMIEQGYSDSHLFGVYKPQQNTTGMEWIFAMEWYVVGYKQGIRACSLTFTDMNPVSRHNLMFAHQVGSKLKYAGQEEDQYHAKESERCILSWQDHLQAGLHGARDWRRLRQRGGGASSSWHQRCRFGTRREAIQSYDREDHVGGCLRSQSHRPTGTGGEGNCASSSAGQQVPKAQP